MLKSLDKMAPPGCAYARYMDDWIIFANTCWQLRRVIKNMHEVVHGLRLKLALDKTFIGRIHKSFDFLGYRFLMRLGFAAWRKKTIDNNWNKRLRLYEQGTPDQRVQAYTKTWQRWVRAGLDRLCLARPDRNTQPRGAPKLSPTRGMDQKGAIRGDPPVLPENSTY